MFGLLVFASSLVEAATIEVTATCEGTGVVSSHTARSATCTSPLTEAGANVLVSTTGAAAHAFAGTGHGRADTPSTQARAYLDLFYNFTFHGPAGTGGRYQPCLTEEHSWFFDGTPITSASFEGISGGSETEGPHFWGSSACEGNFNPAATREFVVGETLTARLILEALADASGRSGEIATASFNGFRVFDDGGAPLSGVTWTLVPDVQPVPEPRTSLLFATAVILGLSRRKIRMCRTKTSVQPLLLVAAQQPVPSRDREGAVRKWNVICRRSNRRYRVRTQYCRRCKVSSVSARLLCLCAG